MQLLNQVEVKGDLKYLTMCDPNFSIPSPLWSMTHCTDQLHLTTRSNFMIRFLLGCHGLESDAYRLRNLVMYRLPHEKKIMGLPQI